MAAQMARRLTRGTIRIYICSLQGNYPQNPSTNPQTTSSVQTSPDRAIFPDVSTNKHHPSTQPSKHLQPFTKKKKKETEKEKADQTTPQPKDDDDDNNNNNNNNATNNTPPPHLPPQHSHTHPQRSPRRAPGRATAGDDDAVPGGLAGGVAEDGTGGDTIRAAGGDGHVLAVRGARAGEAGRVRARVSLRGPGGVVGGRKGE
ncbi:hypothetical protein B0J12DRAFT_349022 [Macrophomina phaseolina]|uniref:Uncharacterized protein n=1 Tax=Macrophomina phaseolina TaxID=35725 RepID=A0ABQ8GQB5_9PEZI|nr:hypothetical protein B0J12DRAFT_349022 [Macrophomina phaseolina]